MTRLPSTLPFIVASLGLVALAALTGLLKVEQVPGLVMIGFAAASWWETHHRP